MRFRINFGALKKIKDNIKREFGDKVDASELVEDIVRTAGVRALAKAQKRTPKDTGQLRQGWRLGKYVKRGFNSTIDIENPVEYATYIELGHRVTDKQLYFLKVNNILDPSKPKKSKGGWYKGHFMATKSVEEVKEELPDIAEERMIKKCLEIFP